jgi:hypothetical protein
VARDVDQDQLSVGAIFIQVGMAGDDDDRPAIGSDLGIGEPDNLAEISNVQASAETGIANAAVHSSAARA